MKYTIYEDPITHRFAHLPLPRRFLDGDELPAVVTERWFTSHEAAIAALAELLDRDDGESAQTADAAQSDARVPLPHAPLPSAGWFTH